MAERQGTVRRPRFRRMPLGRPWCEALELDNGRRLILRPIEPSDDERLRASFGHLTPEEIRFRFLHPINELTPEYARSLTRIDSRRAFALIAVEALPPEQALIGAVARARIEDDGQRAEFALIVGREIGGFGLGSYVLTRLMEWCRKKGVRQLYGDVMIENERMLRLTRRLGFAIDHRHSDGQVVRVIRELRRP